MKELDNPFYNNERAIIKWWQYPILWFLTTYVQINEGHVWYYKLWNGQIFLIKSEKLEVLDDRYQSKNVSN